MFPFLAFLLGLALGVCGWRYWRLNRLIEGLNQAVQTKRPFLLEKPFGWRGFSPVDHLCRNIRQLIEVDARFSGMAADLVPHLGAALENMQEVVLIVDQGNYVVMANGAAREILANGGKLQGKRLEQVMRSAAFLDFVNSVKAGEVLDRQEIEVHQAEELFWFEVTGARMAGLGNPVDDLTLFVLHDISRLKHLEKMRKDFVANVSHELKTPLTVIKGYAETLVEDHDTLPVEARERFLVKILRSVERLHLLIEDLLTLSRLESGPDKLKRMPHHLPTLIGDLLENFERRLDPETQRIERNFADGVGYVHIDGLRVSQAVENLVDNAIRYATGFSCIRVTLQLSPDGGKVECAVEDDGVGIPKKDLPHIFERFYRVDKGRSRERGGTGLGLSIVKHIILLHGGEISAESETGKGTTVRFTLPARLPDGVEVPGSPGTSDPAKLAVPETMPAPTGE